MKLFLGLMSLIFVLVVVTCNGQPNTSSTVEVGIVNPQPQKNYRIFTDVKNDSISGSRLVDGMDFLNPSVTDLEKNITNWETRGDTLFGTFAIPDVTYERFIVGGLVQVNSITLKYSEMAVSYWVNLDMIEPNAAGFIFRRKR